MASTELIPDTQFLGLQPPHSIEAEQSTLGALMLANESWDDVCELLSAEAFYLPPHRMIFRVMSQLAADQQPMDVVTLSERFDTEDLNGIGGLAYLAELARQTPSATNIVAYANIVREHHRRRQLSEVGRSLNQQALEGNEPSKALIEGIERRLFDLAEDRQTSSTDILPALAAAIDTIDRACQAKDGVTGTPTGFKDLDELTGGWQDADLIIIAGRPSMGKTGLGMNLVEHALASKHARCVASPVFVFSLEMPAEQLMLRMMASLGRLDLQSLRTGRIDDHQWSSLSAATSLLNDYKDRLFVDDECGLTATALRSRARRMMRRHGRPSLILIDYLQLLSEPGAENRTNEISAVSRILKAMGRELGCPVIALSQLNRSLEHRPNKRPVMADLRDSGSIEQDADVIAFVYRDEVYNRDNPDNKGRAELIIAKQRNGPTGIVHLAYLPSNTRFESLEWRQTQENGSALFERFSEKEGGAA